MTHHRNNIMLGGVLNFAFSISHWTAKHGLSEKTNCRISGRSRTRKSGYTDVGPTQSGLKCMKVCSSRWPAQECFSRDENSIVYFGKSTAGSGLLRGTDSSLRSVRANDYEIIVTADSQGIKHQLPITWKLVQVSPETMAATADVLTNCVLIGTING